MKKTLAIVLALVMVLAMIPAMSAHTSTKNVEMTHKELDLKVYNAADTSKVLGSAATSATVTAKYDFEAVDAVATGKWSEKTKMAIVEVKGFDFVDAASVKSVKIDDKELAVADDAAYKSSVGKFANGQINFPVELTKAGYSDTYLITVVSETTDASGLKTVTTEYAKISVVLQNDHAYKGEEKATITNIASKKDDVAAYIVGDKIYFDFVADTKSLVTAEITFADENGKAFSAITYAYNPVIKSGSNYAENTAVVSTVGATETKLDKSAAKFDFAAAADGKTIKFKLETKAANYETKDYTVKMRTGIVEEDPKGIYFAETTKTIAMGETYAPVVMGVKTGKQVAAKILVPDATDIEVIDVVDNKVIGTREGVAYITAEYKAAGQTTTYKSSSMKIIVTLPGESIPALDPAAEIYYVTCRALNVRAGAGTSYKKVDLIHRGDAVKVVELKNGWAKLADGTYVCAKYIAK